MNEVQLGQALKTLANERGLSDWELSRQANVKIELVAAALKGRGSVPLSAWCRLATALNSELTLSLRSERTQEIAGVETVVDCALRRLRRYESSSLKSDPR